MNVVGECLGCCIDDELVVCCIDLYVGIVVNVECVW